MFYVCKRGCKSCASFKKFYIDKLLLSQLQTEIYYSVTEDKGRMKLRDKLISIFLSTLTIVLTFVLCLYAADSAVLNPKGIIGIEERNLIAIATILMLIIVIPVLIMTLVISYRYRASNKEAKYTPYWDHSYLAEAIWWGFPFIIVISLSIITWTSTHKLDPFKPLISDVKPLKIQVVALQWKWLFIYPEQQIASLNFLQFPEKTPLEFDLTSDAPMNSFWIPQLGGQIYAMPGMRTKLHLIADEKGRFRGSSANLSGAGFAGMNFIAEATSPADFDAWVKAVKEKGKELNPTSYNTLVKPSKYDPVLHFQLKDLNLFEQIVMKYMAPMEKHTHE